MRQKMERVGAVCPELLRYRQNSWDNSCRKDLENPGNSGKAKTQERKNKKRPAVCSAGGKKEAEEGRNLPQSSNRFDVQFQSYRRKSPDA